jgi:hypothetical protein
MAVVVTAVAENFLNKSLEEGGEGELGILNFHSTIFKCVARSVTGNGSFGEDSHGYMALLCNNTV